MQIPCIHLKCALDYLLFSKSWGPHKLIWGPHLGAQPPSLETTAALFTRLTNMLHCALCRWWSSTVSHVKRPCAWSARKGSTENTWPFHWGTSWSSTSQRWKLNWTPCATGMYEVTHLYDVTHLRMRSHTSVWGHTPLWCHTPQDGGIASHAVDQGWATFMMEKATIFYLLQVATMHIQSKIPFFFYLFLMHLCYFYELNYKVIVHKKRQYKCNLILVIKLLMYIDWSIIKVGNVCLFELKPKPPNISIVTLTQGPH